MGSSTECAVAPKLTREACLYHQGLLEWEQRICAREKPGCATALHKRVMSWAQAVASSQGPANNMLKRAPRISAVRPAPPSSSCAIPHGG